MGFLVAPLVFVARHPEKGKIYSKVICLGEISLEYLIWGVQMWTSVDARRVLIVFLDVMKWPTFLISDGDTSTFCIVVGTMISKFA